MSLITTIAEFKKYIAIDANTQMATLQPYIDEAEQLYVKDLLSQAFYDVYHPLYLGSVAETPTPLSAQNAALLPFIQRCLAYYTQLLAIPHLAVSFGDMGMRQHRAEDSDAAPRWLIEKLQLNALKNGDLHADKLLAFLEANASAVAGNYEQWFGSSANTKMSGYIVYSATIASKHIAINNSRRVYLQLRNRIRDIETKSIPKLIGQAQYDDLVVDIKAGTISAEYAKLIEKLEPVIAKRALYMQLPFMRVQINENGVMVYSGTDEVIKPGQLATDADIKILRAQLMDEKEFGYMADENELRQFILDNIEDYPLIKASTAYTVQPDPGPTWETLNDPDNKFLAL